MPLPICPESGKLGFCHIIGMVQVAKDTTAIMNQAGDYATTWYAYRCPSCEFRHLTHHKQWRGQINDFVYAPDPDLQKLVIDALHPPKEIS